VTFEKGIERIAGKSKAGFRLVFYAALIDYFSRSKPELNIYLAGSESALANSAEDLQTAYNLFLQDCISRQMPE
jgi:hypothetical protein